MHISYNTDYTASQYAFDTTRKSAAVAEKAANIPNVEIIDPAPFYKRTEELVTQNHRTGYVLAVKNGEPYHLAESQGFNWDSGIYTMAIAHNAGVVAAVDTVLTQGHTVAGTLSSGLHHAKWDSGDGFCTFNGLAMGAHHAVELGARVLIFDFDAHCGGGTNEVSPKQTVQVDISTSIFDRYKPNNPDSRLITLGDADDALYIDAIKAGLEYASSLGTFDLMIYNAGMDPFNTGISKSALAQREQMVADWVSSTNTPSIFTLAGGYTWGGVTMDELADLHCMTIMQYAGISSPVSS